MNLFSQNKNQSCLSPLSAIFFGLIFFSSQISPAADIERKYPPYPDVWGHKLPIGNRKAINDINPLSFYKLPDGDVLITYVTQFKQPKFEYAGLSFFSGRQWVNKEIDLNQLPEHLQETTELSGSSRFLYPVISFSNDSHLGQRTRKHIRGCDNHATEEFEMLSPDGKTLWRKKLIHLLPKPIIESRHGRCDGEFEEFIIKIRTYEWNILLLVDETFILKNDETNWILRFDKSMHTKYPIGHEWVVIDSAEWEAIPTPTGTNDQTIIDDKINYLKSKIKQETKP